MGDLVEQAPGPLLGVGVELVEVSPLSGGRVGVSEDPLNVVEIEAVPAVVAGVLVHDSSGAAAEVVGAEVTKSCGGGPSLYGIPDGAGGGGLSPADSSGVVGRESFLRPACVSVPRADERVGAAERSSELAFVLA